MCNRLQSELQKVSKFSPAWFQLKEELLELNIILEDSVEEEEPHHDKSQEIDECLLPLVASSEADTVEDFLSCHGNEELLCTSRRSVYRLVSNKTLDDILFKPLYFSALLVVMAHNRKMRYSGLLVRPLQNRCIDVSPTILSISFFCYGP